jgi:hypothetical protein
MKRGRSEIERRLETLEANGCEAREQHPECTPEEAARTYERFLAAKFDPDHPYDGPDLRRMSAVQASRVYAHALGQIMFS